MEELTCVKQGPGVTPHGVQQTAGRTWWLSSLQGKGRLPRELTSGFASLVTRETSEGAGPLCPCWLKQSSAGAWGKYLGRSVKCKQYKWNRHLKGRRCRENKRTTILSGMTIHSTPMYPAWPLKSWSSSLMQFPGVRCVEGDCNQIP